MGTRGATIPANLIPRNEFDAEQTGLDTRRGKLPS